MSFLVSFPALFRRGLQNIPHSLIHPPSLAVVTIISIKPWYLIGVVTALGVGALKAFYGEGLHADFSEVR
jgi:hypothetical protein